jgi:hypothetical protein
MKHSVQQTEAIAKAMFYAASLSAAFLVGFACAYLMWGA